MEYSATTINSRIDKWAARQLADYDACQPGTMFAEGVVLEVDDAYELQAAVAKLRVGRGEQVIGYKVGCTSPRIRSQLGIDHCVTGRLYDSESHPSGAKLPRSKFANLATEGELAVRLSRAPRLDDFSEGDIPACVEHVFPVIELHNHLLRGEQPSAGELIANNAIHAGFVAGGGVSAKIPRNGLSFLSIFADDRRVEKCAGSALFMTMHASLKWLMEMMDERGEQLGAGQIVLTGSIPSLIPIHGNCRIRVDTTQFGSVEADFID